MASREFEWIEKIKKTVRSTFLSDVIGIGDDCAMISRYKDCQELLSTDALIEGVHFDLNYYSFYEVGYKAAQVNLSDIAAMGGRALYCLVSLGVPTHVLEDDILEFYKGFDEALENSSAYVIGGNLSKSPNSFMVNVTVVGEVESRFCKKRSTAQANDLIYVTGMLGNAALGLVALQLKQTVPLFYEKAQKSPRAQTDLGKALGALEGVTAMMDISDGLLQDLSHLLKASALSAKINQDQLPLASDFIEQCQRLNLNPHHTALTGGEDYGLLFTATPELKEALANLSNTLKTPITCIGKVLPLNQNAGFIEVYDDKGSVSLPDSFGFSHF